MEFPVDKRWGKALCSNQEETRTHPGRACKLNSTLKESCNSRDDEWAGAYMAPLSSLPLKVLSQTPVTFMPIHTLVSEAIRCVQFTCLTSGFNHWHTFIHWWPQHLGQYAVQYLASRIIRYVGCKGLGSNHRSSYLDDLAAPEPQNALKRL